MLAKRWSGKGEGGGGAGFQRTSPWMDAHLLADRLRFDENVAHKLEAIDGKMLRAKGGSKGVPVAAG